MATRDTRLMARAISERWPIQPEYRAIVIRKLLAIIADPESSNREVTAAIKAIISADAVNLKAQEIQQQNDHHHDRIDLASLHRIAEVARSIGLNDIAQRAIEAGSDRDTIRDDADQ